MNNNDAKKFSKNNYLYRDKTYFRDMIIILLVSIFFLMIRFGAIIPDLGKLSIQGFQIINLSKTIAALYLVWFYLYFSFYQKYCNAVEKEIVKCKEKIFEDKIAFSVLRETHERSGHYFDWFTIYSLSLSPVMKFWISYSPLSFLEYGEDKVHGRRHWVIDLKLKHNRKHTLHYLTEVYFRSPIVTAYRIPFLFPILACAICMLGDWPGSLIIIFKEFWK